MWYGGFRLVLAGNLEDTLVNLESRGASDIIINRVRNAPLEYQGHYISHLMRNPLLSEQDLDAAVYRAVEKQQNSSTSTPLEQRISQLYLPQFQIWPLVHLRKLRSQQLGQNSFTYKGFEGGTPEDMQWNVMNTFQQIADWSRHSYQEDPYFQLAVYNFNQALSKSNDWHNFMAGQGSEEHYTPYQRDEDGNINDERVVFNYPDGWHIAQLKNANDLRVEGNRMNHCFAPGALVRTFTGFKPIEMIGLGELVVCGDGTFRKVTKLFKQPYTGSMIRLGTRVGVGCNLITPNHEFLSLKKLHGGDKPCQSHRCGKSSRYNEHEAHDVEWTPIGELSIDSHLVVSCPTEYFDIDKLTIPEKYTGIRRKGTQTFEVNDDFLWIIGMFIAEGSSTKNKIQFAISKNEIEYADRLECFFNKHNFGYHWRKDIDSYGGRVLIVGSRMLAEWLGDWVGRGCSNKQIPSELLNLPNNKIESLARGILDGDGCFSRNVLHQTSSILALQMSEISLRLGGFPSISVKHPKNKRVAYVLEGADALIPRTSIKRGFWKHKEHTLVKPTIFDTEQYSGFVYNLEIDTIHSYSVQNILVHNCVGGYCRTVENGESRIFSLRDPRNRPKVTIEMAGRDNTIKQIKAHSDEMPPEELRLRLAEWFQNLEDVSFNDAQYEWQGPDWDTDPGTIIGCIYDEAYGPQDEDNDSDDYHDDYGLENGVDNTREVINLDVDGLLENVEKYMVGWDSKWGGFDIIRTEPKYYSEDRIAEVLAEVILKHDEAILNQMIENPSSPRSAGWWGRKLFNPDTKTYDEETVRSALGIFNVSDLFYERKEEALKEMDVSAGVDEVADENDNFRLYYITLDRILKDMPPELGMMYQKLTGSKLINDLNQSAGGKLLSVWGKTMTEHVQPRLMKHMKDYPEELLPRKEDGTVDTSQFDENGWKYAKKILRWYK